MSTLSKIFKYHIYYAARVSSLHKVILDGVLIYIVFQFISCSNVLPTNVQIAFMEHEHTTYIFG
jgi:hypothetical protein